ncbi:hypothetical protein BDZ97DRAFT_1183822 [Flammula alnicola]|nr:hypothetical protein BDZ97DRAFT_1183822 [Flammula alnicola]
MSTAFAGSLSHPRLPPELISLIFEFLAADRDWVSLGACSLLSNQCLRSARKLLFLSVTLRLRSDPNPILIHDISRRIQGLCDLLKRDPDTSRYIKVFEVLDSYPVYDSQWITQQTSLPRLINKLTNVQECTFGSEVGYLQWGLFSPELATSLQKLFSYPHLKILTLCNVGMIPTPVLKIPVRYLHLNNITTLPTLALLGEEPVSLSTPDSRLCYLNVRTVSLANTDSAWELMQVHSTNLKLIKWRCWEGTYLSYSPLVLTNRNLIHKLTVYQMHGQEMGQASPAQSTSGSCPL